MNSIALCFLLAANCSHGFLVQPNSNLATMTTLFGKNSKRGRLGILAEDGVEITPSRTKVNSNKKSKDKKSTVPVDGSTIAPGLADWVAKQEGDSTTTQSASSLESTDSEFQEGSKGKSERRVKQGVRQEQEAKRTAEVGAAVDALEKALEENGNLDQILSAVSSIMESESGNLKTILSGKKRLDYRLAWVGSDDAICRVGTGLHKVPLARLQEVFLSCLGKNRLEISEVIRILGPFPNVRNILQGSANVGKGQLETLNIVLDSMVDGTGKEILAGTEDNIRRVHLQIYFCDERAIVAVVPPEDGSSRSDALEKNGANVLVFVREEELDEKLDQLRVS